MCGFCGYVNSYENILDEKIITDMTNTLKKRGPIYQKVYINNTTALSNARLSAIEDKNNNKLMTKNYKKNNYTIIYSGRLYNAKELRNNLLKKEYHFEGNSDTETVLNAYFEYGKNLVKYLNGAFSFAIYNDKDASIFLARDRLGLKPLFYYLNTTSTPLFAFSTEIKAILKHPDITPIMDKQGLMELIGLGPAHTPGFTYFKNIKEMD